MKTLAIVDVETAGLDPTKDPAIELGVVLWSVEHRTLLASFSQLLPAAANPCEPINRIPAKALPADGADVAADWVRELTDQADAVTAWNAAFDRQWIEPFTSKPWFCSMDDLGWSDIGYPKDGGKSLISVALWHHCGVASAHRAIDDCLLLGRLFAAVARDFDSGDHGVDGHFDAWLERGLARGMAPRARFVSLAPFEMKDVVKAAGFNWNEPGFERQWSREMPIAEAKDLPFRVRQVGG